jgi:hypothetical protein
MVQSPDTHLGIGSPDLSLHTDDNMSQKNKTKKGGALPCIHRRKPGTSVVFSARNFEGFGVKVFVKNKCL